MVKAAVLYVTVIIVGHVKIAERKEMVKKL